MGLGDRDLPIFHIGLVPMKDPTKQVDDAVAIPAFASGYRGGGIHEGSAFEREQQRLRDGLGDPADHAARSEAFL